MSTSRPDFLPLHHPAFIPRVYQYNFDRRAPRNPNHWRPVGEVPWPAHAIGGYRTTAEERAEIAKLNIERGVSHLIVPDTVDHQTNTVWNRGGAEHEASRHARIRREVSEQRIL